MTDILERLRDVVVRGEDVGTVMEAVTEIRRLREEGRWQFERIANKDIEIERLNQDANEAHADLCAENDNMRAEIERLRKVLHTGTAPNQPNGDTADEIKRLRAVIIRAKDSLLDGQSTQWVHDLLVNAVLWRKP